MLGLQEDVPETLISRLDDDIRRLLATSSCNFFCNSPNLVQLQPPRLYQPNFLGCLQPSFRAVDNMLNIHYSHPINIRLVAPPKSPPLLFSGSFMASRMLVRATELWVSLKKLNACLALYKRNLVCISVGLLHCTIQV